MLGRCAKFLILTLCLTPTPSQAQDGPKPELGLIFPLTQKNDKIFLSKTIWLAPSVVLSKGTQLLTIYTPPRQGDADVERSEGQLKFKSATAAHRGVDKETDIMASALEQRAERTVWRDISIFRAMLQVIDRQRQDAYIVLIRPGEKEKENLAINFPEGTLWAEDESGIISLWTRNGSRSQQLGVTKGAKLLAINGKTVNSLAEADTLWRSSTKEGIYRKTWLISNGATIKEVDFGQTISLDKSAIESW